MCQHYVSTLKKYLKVQCTVWFWRFDEFTAFKIGIPCCVYKCTAILRKINEKKKKIKRFFSTILVKF